MDAKDLRRLGRKELLELLLEQTKRADALQEEVNKVKELLEDRSIRIAEAGSIAEAALQLNNIFDVAQKVADEYLENVKRISEETDSLCEMKTLEANVKAESIVAEATAKSEAMVAEATEKVETLLADAKAETEAYWDKLKAQLDSYYEAHKGLKEMLKLLG